MEQEVYLEIRKARSGVNIVYVYARNKWRDLYLITYFYNVKHVDVGYHMAHIYMETGSVPILEVGSINNCTGNPEVIRHD